MSSAPVNLFWDMGEGASRVTLVSMQTPFWFAAKCRRRECPLEQAPFECPFQIPCTSVRGADWETVSVYLEEEEEDHG